MESSEYYRRVVKVKPKSSNNPEGENKISSRGKTMKNIENMSVLAAGDFNEKEQYDMFCKVGLIYCLLLITFFVFSSFDAM